MKYRFSLVVFAFVMFAAFAPAQTKTIQGSATNLARGKYLVEQAGLCADCHSPRNQKGEFIHEQWLQGAPIMFKPTVPMPAWADKAPNIAGLPGWKDEDAVKFLMTGVAYNGLPANPPMPPFRFSRADASAIVAYLKSMGPAQPAAKKPSPQKKVAAKASAKSGQ